jgi:hypothetical protein
VAAANGRPSYFRGRSYAGIDLTAVEDEGDLFIYGTCEYRGDGGCAPPRQVQNGPEHLSGAVRGCARLRDIRGVPAVSLGGGVVLFKRGSAVKIPDDGTGTGGDLRNMAQAVRPVSGPADVTRPLPAPTKYVLNTLAAKCGAGPGDHGRPIED